MVGAGKVWKSFFIFYNVSEGSREMVEGVGPMSVVKISYKVGVDTFSLYAIIIIRGLNISTIFFLSSFAIDPALAHSFPLAGFVVLSQVDKSSFRAIIVM